jgi:probable rRNA maturation factor
MTVRLSGPPRRRGLPAIDKRLLRARAVHLLRAVEEARAELSIALVDDAEIAELNAEYRGLDRATDVLSFSLREGKGADYSGSLLGDVVIGLETAARQARGRRRSVDDEVARLLIHGTLHLLGHDHEREEDGRVMRREERRLWREVRDPRGRRG